MGTMQWIYSDWLTPPDQTSSATDHNRKQGRDLPFGPGQSGNVPARPTTGDRKSVPAPAQIAAPRQDEMMDGEKGCVPNPSIEEARPDIHPGALGPLRKCNAHGGGSCNRSYPESASN